MYLSPIRAINMAANVKTKLIVEDVFSRNLKSMNLMLLTLACSFVLFWCP